MKSLPALLALSIAGGICASAYAQYPASTGNQFMDAAMRTCSKKYNPNDHNEHQKYTQCVSKNITEQMVNPMAAMQTTIADMNNLANDYAQMQNKLALSPLSKKITEEIGKAVEKVTDKIQKWTQAFTKMGSGSPFSSPGRGQVKKGGDTGWGPSRTTCCGSEPQQFQERTEEMVQSLSQIYQETVYINNNLMLIGQVKSALDNEKRKQQTESARARLQSLAEIAKRRSIVASYIANDENYPSDPALRGKAAICTPTSDNMLANIPLANTWLQGTQEINTVHISQRPFLNPNLLDGRHGNPADLFEQWLLATPQFQPQNLWSVFMIPRVGYFDQWTLRLSSFGRYGDSKPANRSVEQNNDDRAPLVKAPPKTDDGMNKLNLAYEPTAHATNLMVNMLLDPQSVPPSMNPSLRKRSGLSKLFYIFTNLPAYTGNEAGSSTNMPFKAWKDWARKTTENDPYQQNVMAEMAIREIHAATIKRVLSSYMLENYRLFQAPEGKTASQTILEGFADAFLPVGEQNNGQLFTKFNIQTDEATSDWAKSLGLEVRGAYTEAQKRDMTISLLSHPYMQEVTTRTRGDDLRRLQLKYINTLGYLRKKRLDELKKQRMLLVIINETRTTQERMQNAAQQAKRVIQ